jgi:pimeloyl-ACP methyl ester carboxylesterase
MLRWIRRVMALVAILLLSAAAAGAIYQYASTARELAAQEPPGRLVDVGGFRLHIWCTGAGAPTVVLDSGLGGTAFDWERVQPDVARFTRVCSYDRAGMGYSDSGPHPRTSRQIVNELASLLDRIGETGIMLVGASIGGWNVRLFATERTDRVAGLVLVDARHEDQSERMSAAGAPEPIPPIAHVAPVIAHLGIGRLLGFAPGLPPDAFDAGTRKYVQATRFRASALVTAANELLNGKESAAQVRTSRRELPMPVIVISAGLRDSASEVLAALQRDQLTLSRQSRHVIAERSGHNIPHGQPAVIVESIRSMVDALRQSAR